MYQPRHSARFFVIALILLATFVMIGSAANAQVHYHKDGRPWKQTVNKGPDAKVKGWFYNLGPTGLRVELMPDEPTHLLVKHVLKKSPAARYIKAGDVILGAGNKTFKTEHQNGYGMEVFGPKGPILEFANAIEQCRGQTGTGWLQLSLRRGKKKITRKFEISRNGGNFNKTYPKNCKKSERVLSKLLPYLVEEQRKDGSWGSEPINLFAPLAMMAADRKKYSKSIKKALRFHAKNTKSQDESSLINWRYMAAAIVLSEHYLATREKWVIKELKEIRDFILWSQYMGPNQIRKQAHKSHPDSIPKKPGQKVGGWGHNPGHEGYGAISMITAQGAISFALMERCGISIPKKPFEAAFDFLARGTGKNGYLWYEDDVADQKKWADMGRTGAAALANFLYSGQNAARKKLAQLQAKCMGDHPQSFPDTHGSPLMGMGFGALGSAVDPQCFRKVMNANRWWFTLSECPDGSFYYQPNRDNAGYNDRSRVLASAITAFILTMDKPALQITGKPFKGRKK